MRTLVPIVTILLVVSGMTSLRASALLLIRTPGGLILAADDAATYFLPSRRELRQPYCKLDQIDDAVFAIAGFSEIPDTSFDARRVIRRTYDASVPVRRALARVQEALKQTFGESLKAGTLRNYSGLAPNVAVFLVVVPRAGEQGEPTAWSLRLLADGADETWNVEAQLEEIPHSWISAFGQTEAMVDALKSGRVSRLAYDASVADQMLLLQRLFAIQAASTPGIGLQYDAVRITAGGIEWLTSERACVSRQILPRVTPPKWLFDPKE